MSGYKYILDHGSMKRVGLDFQAQYRVEDASEFFSPVTNMIPALSSVSGARVMIGDKASVQAMTLVNREAPLVQAATKKGKVFAEEFGRLASIRSTAGGTVHSISDDHIVVKDEKGVEHSHDKHTNYIVGRESHMDHTPVVKVGDKVEKDHLLATSNYSDHEGKLAVGMNLKTAIMPFRSMNFEDALAISESAAKKLEGEQLIPVRLELERGAEIGKSKYVSMFPNRYYNDQLSHIADNGVVKKGAVLHHGDPIILAFVPKTLKSLDIQLGRLSRVIKNAFSDVAKEWHYEYPGEVVDVSVTGKLVTVTVKTRRPMSNADKLSMPFGAKGVVQIVPDTQMPTGEDGKPIDVLLNTMSITSRVAPGLVNAMGLGKVAQKLGKPIKMTGFTEGSSVEKVMEAMKKHDVSETEKVYDPISGRHIEVFTGPLYYNRLHHIAEDKISTRSAATTYDGNMQPSKAGSDEKAKRMGNLATTVALSNDAKAVLRDVATIRGTKNDEWWTALKLGQAPPPAKVPFVFNKFLGHLQGSGVTVQQNGSRFNILPQTDRDVLSISKGAIREALGYKLKKDELVPEEGGMFDPVLTGITGENYNHVVLAHRIPNPISEDPLRKLLKMTKVAYEDAMANGKLEERLKAMDVDQELTRLKQFIRDGRKSGRDEAVKSLSFLTTLKEHGLKPIDLMQSLMPVIPAQYRPVSSQGSKVISADVNELYKDLMIVNHTLTDAQSNHDTDPAHVQAARKQLYAGVKAVYGLGEPVSQKSVEKSFKGLLATALGLQGGSAKTSFFQAKVVTKPIDLVGRAVLLPDSKLGLSEASIPQQLAWSIFSPFIIRRLVRKGVPATKASEYLKNKHPLAQEALQEEMHDRPGMVSRDPMLSKYNLQGMFLKLNPNPKDFSIKLNPLVFASYGGDCDGDQLNIQLPASEEAKDEVKEKMIPDKNLIYHRTFTPIYRPSNEAATGIFAASYEDKKNKAKTYGSAQEVVRDYLLGKLDIGDQVTVS